VTSSILRGDHFGCVLVDHGRAHPSRKSSLANTSSAARYSRYQHSSSDDDVRASRNSFNVTTMRAAILIQRLQRRQRQFRTIAMQRRKNILASGMREPVVDVRSKRGDRSRGVAGREAIDSRLSHRWKSHLCGPCERLAQGSKPGGRHHGIGKSA